MMTKAHVPALSMVGERLHRGLWGILRLFGHRETYVDNGADCVGMRAVATTASRPHSTPYHPFSVTVCPDAPIHYLAFGVATDRKAFTIAIRAFALAGKWGDRLTLVGCGRHRRGLEKWSAALGIEAIVTFAESHRDTAPGFDGHDMSIPLSHGGDHQFTSLREVRTDGLRVIAMSEESVASLSRDRPHVMVAARDVLSLSNAMLKSIAY